MSEIKITIKLFGAFRKYGQALDLVLPAGSSVQDVKVLLAGKLESNDAALVAESALANDNEILSGTEVFNDDTALAILPPVCGG